MLVINDNDSFTLCRPIVLQFEAFYVFMRVYSGSHLLFDDFKLNDKNSEIRELLSNHRFRYQKSRLRWFGILNVEERRRFGEILPCMTKLHGTRHKTRWDQVKDNIQILKACPRIMHKVWE